MIFKNLKGELTSNQLIAIIILIISFSIILIFIFTWDFEETIDEETCRNSIVMRGAIPVFKDSVQIKCKTKNLCFSMGGECEFSDSSKIVVEGENSLVREIGELIYSCWNINGQGKIDYSSGDYCNICYRIRFDDKIREESPDGIAYEGIYSYLMNFKTNSDSNALYSMYKLGSAFSVKNEISLRHDGLDIYSEKIDVNEDYVIVYSHYDDKFNPPILIKFSGSELNSKLECDEFVNEI
jgi:hypothetical protein